MFTERLKFYADTPRGEKNKLHCFYVSAFKLKDALFRFWARDYHIRSAYYDKTNTETGENENIQIPLEVYFDEFLNLKPHQLRQYQAEQQHYHKEQ